MALAKNMARTAIMLGIFAIIGTGIVAFTFDATEDQIVDNERKAVLRNLNALVPATQRDNDLLTDMIPALHRILGTGSSGEADARRRPPRGRRDWWGRVYRCRHARSRSRRIPTDHRSSSPSGAITRPCRTTLSPTINPPGRVRRIAASR